MKAFSMYIGGNAVGNLIQFFIGETFVPINHCDVVWCFRHLRTEFGHDGLTHIQLPVGLVEAVKQGTLVLGADVDVAQEGLTQEAFQNRLVTLHKLGNQRLGVRIGIVFRFDMILFADIVGHHIKRNFLVVLAELYGLHGFTHQFGVIKQKSLPHKDGVALQVKVGHQVGIGIDFMLAAAFHLLLTCFQEVKHGGFVGEFGINGYCLHCHAHGMFELWFGTTVVNRGEQRLLIVVVFGQQIGIRRCKEGAFFDVVGLAESIHPIHVNTENADLMGVRLSGDFKVGNELGKRVATVKSLGIPLFAFLEGGCFAHLGFGKGQFPQRHFLGSKRVTVIGCLHITNDNIIRGAIADNMVHVEQPIDMFRIAHHFGMKQSAAIELVWFDEFPLLCLNVRNLFDGKAELLRFHIYGLERFAIVGHPNPRKEGGVRLYRRLNGTAQTVGIKAAVKDIEKGQVIKNLIFMAYAFRIDTIL